MKSLREKSYRFSLTALLYILALTQTPCWAQNANDGQASKDTAASQNLPKIRTLIVDGQNHYHPAWPKTTAMMKQYLVQSGRFEVDVQRSRFTQNGSEMLKEFALQDGKDYQEVAESKTDPDFKPDFSKYDLVVNNFGFGAADWPAETQSAFVAFMKSGGGLVSVHAADNCFPDWAEYNQMTGLGGWGGRTEKSGPYVYYDGQGQVVRDNSAGKGGNHGPQHQFEIVMRQSHPITDGMPKSFLHAQDELYEQLRGPGQNMTILATAFAAPDQKGSGRHEPMLIAIEYEKGKIFHTTLGHADYSCECVGFITTFLRGAEWAATGEVTLPIPPDFPTADESRTRKFTP